MTLIQFDNVFSCAIDTQNEQRIHAVHTGGCSLVIHLSYEAMKLSYECIQLDKLESCVMYDMDG